MREIQVRDPRQVKLTGAEPLYRRVPTRDEEGKPLSDFMMLIPGLREWPRIKYNDTLAGIQAVLGGCREVVFADLNVPLNLLWVSVKARPGVIVEVVAGLQTRIPEAVLVSPHGRGG